MTARLSPRNEGWLFRLRDGASRGLDCGVEVFGKTFGREAIDAIDDFSGAIEDHYGRQGIHFHEIVEAVRIDDGNIPLFMGYEMRDEGLIFIRIHGVKRMSLLPA